MTGALNTRSPVVLRLLTWQSPSLPLGGWIAAAAAGGAALSASGTALALRTPGPGLRRRVRRDDGPEEPWEGSAESGWRPAWSVDRPGAARSSAGNGRSRGSEDPGNGRELGDPLGWRQAATAGPERPPGEAPPTLSVPYRVIRRGQPEGPSTYRDREAPRPPGQPAQRGSWSSRGVGGSPEPVPASDDWGSDTQEDW